MAYNAIGGFPPQQHPRKDWKSPCVHLGLDTGEHSDSCRKYENHVFLVYLHINKINGHVYVGITHHVNPNKRWGYSGQKYTHCIKFMHAIHKYGWDSFDHIILCRTSKDRAIAMEMALIAHYKRLGISYNITDGGDGAESISEKNRKIISERMRTNHPMKGKHHTPEARAKIAEAGRGRKMKESTRRKLEEKVWSKRRNVHIEMSKESRTKIAKSLSKPVLQLSLDGIILREFSSTIEADRYVNSGNRYNHIADVCNGKRKTANGYRWMYKEERRES